MNAPQNVATLDVSIPSLQMSEDELLRVLESSVYPGAKIESIKLCVGYCKGQRLDPMLKPVHIVPMSVKIAGRRDEYEWRDVIMPGIGLYRTNASRTGEYAGITKPVFGPLVKLKVGEFEFEHPEWCEITVSREVRGQVRNFTAQEFWVENYATKGKDSQVPNAMWQRRKFGQLAKCTEAQALRKAFPEVGSLPTAEEMEGKTLDPSDMLALEGEFKREPTIEQPRSKSEPDAKAPAKPADAAKTNGNGNDKPLTSGMKATIQTQLKNAALTDVDLKNKFGRDADGELIADWTIDQLRFSQVNDVLAWVKNPTGQ